VGEKGERSLRQGAIREERQAPNVRVVPGAMTSAPACQAQRVGYISAKDIASRDT
jgi:hypothetical protein